MEGRVFGRTNREVPRLWFGPLVGGDQSELIDEICKEPAVIDVSAGAGRYGHYLHGRDVMTCSFGGLELERATGAGHAADLLGAHLIETLSSIGRPSLDFYYLRLRSKLSEEVLNGALNCLDDAKGDGVVKYIGLYAEGDSRIVQSMWQFHDAFESVMLPRHPGREADYISLSGFANEKRVGVATCLPFNWGRQIPFFAMKGLSWEVEGVSALSAYSAENPVLVGVRSAQEVAECRKALDGVGTLPTRYLDDYNSPDAFVHMGSGV